MSGRDVARASVVVMVALLVAGCAAGPMSSPSPPGVSPIAPLTSPTPTVHSEPVLPFGGACDNIIPAVDAAPIVGADPARSIASADNEWRYPIETAGGIFCTWSGADEHLEVVALPAELVPVELQRMYASAECDVKYDWSECALARTVGDVWVLASFLEGMEPPLVPINELSTVLDVATSRAAAFASPEAVSRGDDTWDLPECSGLAAALGLETILGNADIYEGLGTEGPGPLDKRIAVSIGAMRECGWTTLEMPFSQLAVFIEPNAGWSFEAQRSRFDSTESVDGLGAMSAFRNLEGYYYAQDLFVTDSVNVLQIGLSPAGDDVDIAANVLSLLARSR